MQEIVFRLEIFPVSPQKEAAEGPKTVKSSLGHCISCGTSLTLFVACDSASSPSPS